MPVWCVWCGLAILRLIDGGFIGLLCVKSLTQLVKNWRVIILPLNTQCHIKILFHWIIFALTSAFLIKSPHDFNKFCKIVNASRFWTTCAIKTIDPSLGRYLILDFKNTQFVDLRAYNFADVTFLKYKISTMWPRWWRHGTLESYGSKIFLLKYFWISFRKTYFT